MNIHLLSEVTVEDTRKAHMADLAIQEKYGVTYLQYWFNEETATVYCLMESPDKESCAATHREAYGIIACQIVEVEDEEGQDRIKASYGSSYERLVLIQKEYDPD